MNKKQVIEYAENDFAKGKIRSQFAAINCFGTNAQYYADRIRELMQDPKAVAENEKFTGIAKIKDYATRDFNNDDVGDEAFARQKFGMDAHHYHAQIEHLEARQKLAGYKQDLARGRITYEQAKSDHAYLWSIGRALDMTGYVDQGDLKKLLDNPTKSTAKDCFIRRIAYWFQEGPERDKQNWKDDRRVDEIRARYV